MSAKFGHVMWKEAWEELPPEIRADIGAKSYVVKPITESKIRDAFSNI